MYSYKWRVINQASSYYHLAVCSKFFSLSKKIIEKTENITYIFLWIVVWNNLEYCYNILLCPPNWRGRGHIAFGTDPVSVNVAHCLHSISWTNGWILTKLAQTHYLEGGKKCLDFRWHWPHFEGHTGTLNFSNSDQKRLCAPYLLNQMTDSGQTHVL